MEHMPLGSAEHRKSSTKPDVRDGNVRSGLSVRRAAGALLLAGAFTGLQASSFAAAAPVADQTVASAIRLTGLNAVVAISSRDAWAVGNEIIDHWNGSKWQSVAGASVPSGVSWHLAAITAIPATNPVQLLAVGATSSHALIER
jgi:hypothetical protein